MSFASMAVDSRFRRYKRTKKLERPEPRQIVLWREKEEGMTRRREEH
jgi:hypothetical protein